MFLFKMIGQMAQSKMLFSAKRTCDAKECMEQLSATYACGTNHQANYTVGIVQFECKECKTSASASMISCC